MQSFMPERRHLHCSEYLLLPFYLDRLHLRYPCLQPSLPEFWNLHEPWRVHLHDAVDRQPMHCPNLQPKLPERRNVYVSKCLHLVSAHVSRLRNVMVQRLRMDFVRLFDAGV